MLAYVALDLWERELEPLFEDARDEIPQLSGGRHRFAVGTLMVLFDELSIESQKTCRFLLKVLKLS